jgi:outer membrane protein OmpA-like peptidoglycan-associated protein
MKKISFILLLLMSYSSYSQNYLGVSSSNYAGTMGMDIQPASFVDGRFRFDLNLFSLNFNAYQNFGAFDASILPKWWKGSFEDQAAIDSWSVDADPALEPDYFGGYSFLPKRYDKNSTGVLGFNTNLQFDLLNVMFHINPKIAIGFGAKIRSITNIDNIDPKLAYLAEQELEDEDFWNTEINEELINVNHMTWAEYGFNYSQIIKEEGEHFIKAGANLKYLAGYAAAYMFSNNFRYDLYNDDTTQFLSGDFGYGYSESIGELADENIDQSGMFGAPKPSARGFGLDLGVVYEWRPEYKDYKYDMDGEMNLWARDQNKYKVRVGLSLTDLGGMSFKKGGLSRDFSVQTSNLFDLNTFETADDLVGVDGIIDSLIGQSTAAGNTEWTAGEKDVESSFFMRTPSAFSFQVDYHIWKSFYVNATGIFNIISRNRDAKVRVPNQFSVTPSFDFAWLGVHLPISMNSYSGFKAGVATRLGPLTMGVTDFRALFAAGNVRGVEFFAGVHVPILYSAPSDIDGDKVSDKVDDCITEPGPWTFKGCPDTDNDGIIDMKDDCPLDSGLVEFKGCPDRDGDSIPDKVDDCPDTPGIAAFNGCPDTDNDGIMDKEDDCPLDSGLVVFKGCPDTDKDGIMDKEDDCPLDSGIVEFNGCPDTDGDGISDQDDACPLVFGEKEFQGCPDTDKDGIIDGIDDCIETPGPKENNGCPWPDSDKDGLLDKDDDCPTIPGPKDNKGCPYTDTDEDGTLDKDDECPNTPGPIENKGCPVLEEKVVEVLKTAFDNLEFRTAKDIILSESKPSLEELSEVLTERPTWVLEISGHTDDVGNADKNMVLSKKRAESVKRFLISKGVTEAQLVIKFFGETAPIADNKTAEGRQKNRRVEMKIVFE